MSLEGELVRTTSDFLCAVCRRPWYADIRSKVEVCINPNCDIRDRTFQTLNVKSSPQLQSYTERRLRDFQKEVISWDRARLVQAAYEARRDLILQLWSGGKVRFQEILKLDELLSLTYGVAESGKGAPQRDFGEMLSDFADYFSDLAMIEDLTSGRFCMAASREMVVLKYWDVIRDEVFRNYGIIPAEATDSEGIFRYADVDTEVKESRSAGLLLDFGAYFERMFDFLSTVKYTFEMYQRTASRHDYDPTGRELAALMGLAYSSGGKVAVWSQAKLATYLRKYAKSKGFVAAFIRKYSGDAGLAPIIPKVAGNVMFDWYTIVFYVHYLVVKNKTKSPEQTVTGSDSFTQVRGKASKIFEERARTFLRNKGYEVAPREVRVKFGGESSGYDVLAAHEDKSVILIAEAKYRDPSPSSLDEEGLMRQEVLGSDGALAWAVGEQGRLDMMSRNAERFAGLLSLKRAFESYQRKAYVITKFRPVIQKYRQVDLVSLPEFYALDL